MIHLICFRGLSCVLFLFSLFKERDTIRALIQNIIQSCKEAANYYAQYNEVLRNNTAILQNNIDMLENLKCDKEDIVSMLRHHEQLNAKRIAHVQTVVDRIDKVVNGNRESISIIAERTNK